MEILDRTHREIMEMLTRMHMLIEKLEVRGIDEGVSKLAQDICRFFDETARPHHAAEEELVFPELLAERRSGAGAAREPACSRITAGSRKTGSSWRRSCGRWRTASLWYDIDVLRSGVPIFTELYRDHIALEETVVYPASRRFHHRNLLRNLPSGK